MTWIDPGNPHPHPLPPTRTYTPVVWPEGAHVPLPPPSEVAARSFIEVALARRTRRDFSALEAGQLSALLSLTCRVQQVGDTQLGFPLTRRPAPSAGAIHPIHLVLLGPGKSAWQRYDPFQHALVNMPTSVDAQHVRRAMEELLSAPGATLLLLAAEGGMTAAKYDHPWSLVWRDAGVLLGWLSMAAEALDLSFCPLGVTGEPWTSRLLDQPGLMGVGAAFVGATPR